MTIKASSNFNTIWILESAYIEMWQYIKNCPTEVGGMGVVEEKEVGGRKYLVVTKILLFDHAQNSVAHFRPDQKIMAKWMGQVMMEAKLIDDPKKKEEYKSLYKKAKFHWHKHPGGCEPSGLDVEIRKEFPSNNYAIFFIGNKREEYTVTIEIYEPIPVTLSGMKLKVFDEQIILKQFELDQLKEQRSIDLDKKFVDTKASYIEKLKSKVSFKEPKYGKVDRKNVTTGLEWWEEDDDNVVLFDKDGEYVGHNFEDYDSIGKNEIELSNGMIVDRITGEILGEKRAVGGSL